MDRLCELLILESLSREKSPEMSAAEKAVRAIHQQLMTQIDQEPDFYALSKQQGLSYSTFRRQWCRIYDLPPRRMLIQSRVEKACELLVNTQRSIAEVAQSVGFSDPLYFSRSFRRETGLSATRYREIYQSPDH